MMRSKILAWVMGISILLSGTYLLALTGCKGSETREAVDNSVETLSGKEKTDQMQKMVQDIDKLEQQQTERLQKTLKESGQE